MVESSPQFDVDLSQARALGNGFVAELCRLREIDPIHWSPASRCWLITRHADVAEALSGKLPLSTKRLVNIGLGAIAEPDRARLFPTIMQYMPNWIIDTDPPVHTRLRKLLVRAFNRKVVESVRPFVQQRVNDLLAKLSAQPQLEFNEQIARQLPGSVILKLIGLPQQHLPRLREWANALAEGVGVPFAEVAALARVDKAMADMNAVLLPEIQLRRTSPRNDLLTELLHAVEDGESLSEEEMLGALHVLIVAGHDTTSNTLTLGLEALARRPDIWEYLYRHPDESLNISLELMRYMAMSTSQPRIVADDFEWHGRQLNRGDLVFLMFAAANRDPRAFADPEAINVRRDLEASMVFAPGLHHCIGHLLAKMQVAEFFVALTQRFAGAQILDERLEFMPQVVFRGLYYLKVRMSPRH
jgi:pimeloyl-[acyl-carrier protein] synthase